MAGRHERNFLVDKVPSLKGLRRAEIRDVFSAIESNGSATRYRVEYDALEGMQHSRSITTVSDGRLTPSTEAIDKERFDELTAGSDSWPFTWPVIEKIRYHISVSGFAMAIDFYRLGLTGLVVAGARFKIPEGAADFVPPEWASAEITNVLGLHDPSLATASPQHVFGEHYATSGQAVQVNKHDVPEHILLMQRIQ